MKNKWALSVSLILVLMLTAFFYFKSPSKPEPWPEEVMSKAVGECFVLAQASGKLFPDDSQANPNFHNYGELEKLMKTCECLVLDIHASRVIKTRGLADFYLRDFWETYREKTNEYLKSSPQLLMECKAKAALES